MKIQQNSLSAQRLIQHGVTPAELAAARIFRLKPPNGDGLTLPIPFFGPIILIRRGWLIYDDDGELEDSDNLKMLRHEFCHVKQILEWGVPTYLWRHIWARIKTRSMLAKSSPEESGCYSAQDDVVAFYRDLPDGG